MAQEEEIKFIVLAAGKGKRMKSQKPKVLHEIFAKPLLAWVLDSIEQLPYESESIVVIGHGAHDVEEYLNNNYKYAKTAHQAQQLGSGHAAAQAVPIIDKFQGMVVITCGDTPLISSQTLNELIKYHKENYSDLTVMTTKLENPYGYGRIIRNHKDEIIRIIEQKDATTDQQEINEVNTGVYCLDWAKIRKAFNDLKNDNAQGEYYLTDIVKWARDNQYKVLGYVAKNSEEIYGINSRRDLAFVTSVMNKRYLEELMNNGVTIVDPNSTFISPETTIEPDCTIFPYTYIEGKNTIFKNCKVGPQAHIRGNCEVGEGCKIGNFVELKNAKIAKNSNVCHLSYIGDANIGNHVNIGAGTIFANYNSITKEKKVSTLQDNVSIGSNSVIVAPVEIGHDAFVAASSCITKNIEENSLAIARAHQREVKNWVNKNKETTDES